MIVLTLFLAVAAVSPPAPKFDALTDCMIAEIFRQGAFKADREPKSADAAAHTAALAWEAFFEPVVQEQLAERGSDPALAAAIEAEETSLRSPEQTAMMHGRMIRAITEAEFVDMLREGAFDNVAKRYRRRQNAPSGQR